MKGYAVVTIKPALRLARIEVVPANVKLEVGQAQQFTAKGYDSEDNELDFEPLWTAAAVDAAQELDEYDLIMDGWFTSQYVGEYLIQAYDPLTEEEGFATAQVIPPVGNIVHIEITPGNLDSMEKEDTRFTVTGYDSEGNAIPLDNDQIK